MRNAMLALFVLTSAASAKDGRAAELPPILHVSSAAMNDEVVVTGTRLPADTIAAPIRSAPVDLMVATQVLVAGTKPEMRRGIETEERIAAEAAQARD